MQDRSSRTIERCSVARVVPVPPPFRHGPSQQPSHTSARVLLITPCGSLSPHVGGGGGLHNCKSLKAGFYLRFPAFFSPCGERSSCHKSVSVISTPLEYVLKPAADSQGWDAFDPVLYIRHHRRYGSPLPRPVPITIIRCTE